MTAREGVVWRVPTPPLANGTMKNAPAVEVVSAVEGVVEVLMPALATGRAPTKLPEASNAPRTKLPNNDDVERLSKSVSVVLQGSLTSRTRRTSESRENLRSRVPRSSR